MTPLPWVTDGDWSWRDRVEVDDYAALVHYWPYDGSYGWTVWGPDGDYQEGSASSIDAACAQADVVVGRWYPITTQTAIA